jgi:acetyl esterase/lipase
MKVLIFALCAVIALGCEPALAGVWQPSPGHTQVSIWPGTPPDVLPIPGPESVWYDHVAAGRPYTVILDVSRPTMTIYSPQKKNTGAAVVVLPGGGFHALAIDLEGTEACEWLTSQGVTCVLLKYRVPSAPSIDWLCHCHPDNLAVPTQSLEDLQRTIGLVRLHAKEWHIDPHKIGVLGFSAGGYLAAEISTKYRKRLYAPIDDADKESARPDFAMLLYPGHLATGDNGLNPNVPVTAETPPAFLVQAENDDVDGVNQALVYNAALQKAGVKVEMHLYAEGGHAFGLRHTAMPITGWPRLAETWLHTIGMIPK